MIRLLICLAALGIAATTSAAASSFSSLEGRWIDAKGKVTVKVQRCGNAYCAAIHSATEKAQESARRGGTPNLIGTQVLTGLTPEGNGTFRGRAFDPKRNVKAAATVRQVERDTLLVKACAVGGLMCKEQLWRRVRG
ncbi:MAG TPA: DUF2147 domain-containing protein [Chloroflexota bacterium]|nr:DUF2147 domain-containing protein [Chloroflexota bacterium]